jgi:hypothetical protein
MLRTNTLGNHQLRYHVTVLVFPCTWGAHIDLSQMATDHFGSDQMTLRLSHCKVHVNKVGAKASAHD